MNRKILHLLLSVMLLAIATTAVGQTEADDVKNGNTKFKNGDLDGAIADYPKAIELNPSYVLPYRHRG